MAELRIWRWKRLYEVQIVLLLVSLLVALSMSACAERVEEEDKTTLSGGWDQDVEQIVMTFQTMNGSKLEDLDLVVSAINEISVAEIGVAVELRLVDAIDAFSEYPLWISNRETIDLMVLNYQDILPYISRGMLYPLDDLLGQYAPYLTQVMEEEGIRLTEGSVVDGRSYGVVSISGKSASGGGIWIPLRYLEEIDFPFEEKHIYSMEELSELFQRLKEHCPDKYPLGQITSGNTYSTLIYYQNGIDALGGDSFTGALLGEEGSLIGNFFATEEYMNFLQYMRQWYLNGYIYPDAAITDAGLEEFISSGLVMTYPLASMPGMGMEEAFGEKTVCLRTTPVTTGGTQYSRAGFWVIPTTSRYPESAMKFLNLMCEDERIANLIQWGIEGKHYVVTDSENGIVDFPEGVNFATVAYYNPLGLYGDRRKIYVQGSVSAMEESLAYTEEAEENEVRFSGFVYSTAQIEKELDQVAEVIAKYVPVLESGSVDFEKYYPEFLEELERAGVNEIIEDKQRQLDEFLAGESE